jgi:hypothetical protein
LCIGEEDDGVGVFEVEEEDEEHHQTVHCEYSDCQSKAWGSTPSKVCHNLDCQTANNNKPLYLCGLCDEKLHQGDKSSHVRFNVDPTRTQGMLHSPPAQFPLTRTFCHMLTDFMCHVLLMLLQVKDTTVTISQN